MHMMGFLRRLGHAVARDAVDDVGAMMAYYAILAVFPLLFCVVTVAALVLPAHTIADAARLALDPAPGGARELIESQVAAVTSQARAGFVLGTVLLAIWGASRCASGLMLALDKLFGRIETRSWLHRQLIAVALTLALAILLALALGLLVAGPILGRIVESRFGLGNAFEIGWTIGQWCAAGLLVMVVWALAYRFLPDTDEPFRIFTPGAAVSVALWLAISRLFGVGLDHFGSYSPIYGALGGSVIFLTWLWLSSMSLLLGAEINLVLAEVRSSTSTRDGGARASALHFSGACDDQPKTYTDGP
jgi:membrane protein